VKEPQKISLVKDFSEFPGGRLKKDGPFSGEEFRERFLVKAIAEGNPLIIDLNGAYSIPPSFLDESFGSLVKLHGIILVKKLFRIILDDDPDAMRELQDIFKTRSK